MKKMYNNIFNDKFRWSTEVKIITIIAMSILVIFPCFFPE